MLGKKFTNKVVLVTGAAQGIGKNIARVFGSEGAKVFIVDIDSKAAEMTCCEFQKKKIKAEFLAADLSARGGPQNIVNQVVKKAGRLDILVNNAGIGKQRTLLEESEDHWDASMNINLRAVFFASQAAIKVMKKNDGGSIVNIGSVAGFMTCHQAPSYHAAKAGINQITKYLAAYAGPFGVRVNAVLPGFIVKDENRKTFEKKDNAYYRHIALSCHPSGTVGSADDVSAAVLFFCSAGSRFITGQNLTVDGGLTLQEQSGLVFRFDKERKNGFRT